MRVFILALMMVLAMPVTGMAQPAGLPETGDEPLEISAQETLAWHRNDKQYIARGAVVVKQGTMTLYADTVTADYRETAAAAMDIHRLTATGNVRIEAQGSTATGGQVVYEVDSGEAVMTGDNLRLESPDQVVTAQERFVYRVPEGRLQAVGDVIVVRGQDRVRADRAAAIFSDDAQSGERRLQELSAEGNVVITTPTETIRGQRGQYRAETNMATLHGDVRIERGPNVLEGQQAEVNLTTQVSRLVGGGDGAGGGRVRGVFYPGSDDAPPPADTP